MPRPRNPRLVALAMLRAIKSDLMLAADRWYVGGRIYLRQEDRTETAEAYRPRLSHEWPEWRIPDWTVLDRECSDMIAQLAEVRRYAREQINRLHCPCGRPLPVTEARAGYKTCEYCAATAHARSER